MFPNTLWVSGRFLFNRLHRHTESVGFFHNKKFYHRCKIQLEKERRSSKVINLEFLTYITDFWKSEGIISLCPSLTFTYQSCQQENQSLSQHFAILQVKFATHNESKNHPTAQEYHRELSSNKRSLGWAKQFSQDVSWYSKRPTTLKSHLHNWKIIPAKIFWTFSTDKL